ncbi:MAG: hypothetical protein IPH72_29905 [Sandaracinaceae bacterium]|nr:hypothetical protein [Sandaracinaceae bacterium]
MSSRSHAPQRRSRSWLTLGLCAAALLGCGEDAPSPSTGAGPIPTAPTTAVTPPEAPPEPPQPAGPTATGASFSLVSSGAESYRAGEVGQFAIELTGRDGWHVNMEYPTVVQLEGEGLSFPSPRLERAQAAQFAEERVRFDVPFTPAAAGDRSVTARVQFAMCNPSNCVPEERTLTLALAVQ